MFAAINFKMGFSIHGRQSSRGQIIEMLKEHGCELVNLSYLFFLHSLPR
jgi:hypothetical protein